MSAEREALRLAELLEHIDGNEWKVFDLSAAELRRLHQVERRYEHIKTMARAMSANIDGNHAWTMMLRDIKGPSLDSAIDAAIAKATGGQT